MNCLLVGLALSLHIGLENNYNQVHPYVMCEKNQIITGAYYNSLDKYGLISFQNTIINEKMDNTVTILDVLCFIQQQRLFC